MKVWLVLMILAASARAEDVSSDITVSSGSYPTEVSWTLACSDGSSLSGGAPYTNSLSVAGGSTCTLTLMDSYGDGWNLAGWFGFDGDGDATLSDGSFATKTFTVGTAAARSVTHRRQLPGAVVIATTCVLAVLALPARCMRKRTPLAVLNVLVHGGGWLVPLAEAAPLEGLMRHHAPQGEEGGGPLPVA